MNRTQQLRIHLIPGVKVLSHPMNSNYSNVAQLKDLMTVAEKAAMMVVLMVAKTVVMMVLTMVDSKDVIMAVMMVV